MAAFASALINWNALWKIVVAALIGGGGVVVAFGFVLLGVSGARAAKNRGVRVAAWTAVGACAVFCVATVALGIYAMVEKPSPKPAPRPHATALPAPGPRGAT